MRSITLRRSALLIAACILISALTGMLLGRVTISGAAPGADPRPVAEPVTPCRILETRGAGSGGPTGVPAAAPVGAGQVLTLQVAGAAGQGGCVVSGGLVGAILNITAVNATADTFLTVYPCDAARPNASTLNPFPGRIVFNSASVRLAAAGTVCIFNNAGSVDVIADVTGILYNHNHDDRYFSETEISAALAPNPLVLPASDFHFGSGTADFLDSIWQGTACWLSTLDLPNGAVLTEIRVFVIDVTAANMSGRLTRQPLTDSVGAAFVAGPTANAALGNTSFTLTIPPGTTVANTHSYTLKICGIDASDRFEAVQITWSGVGLPTLALDGGTSAPGDPAVND